MDLLAVECEAREDAVLVRVKGDVDSTTVGELADHLKAALELAATHPARLVIVDLKPVTFFGSAGLNGLGPHNARRRHVMGLGISVSREAQGQGVGTALIAIGVFLVGAVAYQFLPVASMPSVDFPTISVTANRPGADPETMSATVAAPLT